MTALGRFGIALGAGLAVMAALGVAVALSYHPVRPRVLCAMPLGTGGVAVYFGYTNEAEAPVLEPLGSANHVVPAGEPLTTFLPGSSGSYPAAAFVVNAPADTDVAWTLGPRTVRLDEMTARCPIPTLRPPPEDVVLVLPKPVEVVPPPKPEPIVKPETPPEAPPPPKPIERPRTRPKELVKELVDRPVALELTGLNNLDTGIGIQKGAIDDFGDPAERAGDNDRPEVGGVEGGVVGGTGTVLEPPPPPKRTAAKVKTRPKGEWPADAPPRAGAVLVRLSLLVGTDGTVKQVRVVRGAGPAFDREARAVGLRVVFAAATLDGAPVESWVPWDVEFTPDD